jgi:hypothetical protein
MLGPGAGTKGYYHLVQDLKYPELLKKKKKKASYVLDGEASIGTIIKTVDNDSDESFYESDQNSHAAQDLVFGRWYFHLPMCAIYQFLKGFWS